LVLAAGGRPAAGQGDDVYPVTLTRLGVARTWPVARSTSTPTSPDVVNLVEFEDLHDVVLVGHSYAGLVVTAVADRIPERISVLAYLRQLLDSPPQREEIRAGLWRFYTACATADMPETTRLATTIETWWPATLVALTTRTTNARTEGSNRIIKQVKRAGCGFRNVDNYQRLITAHVAVTRPREQAA
jgi:pimeloyl-ACP methyl ester carboxylesterase